MNPRLRRLLHFLFFTCLAAGTLAALFYAEENWRGARVWNATKRDLKARGESVDARDFIPPAVPDDQNLAMAPLFVRTFQYQVDPGTGLLTFNRVSSWADSDTFKVLQAMPWGDQSARPALPSGYGRNGNWMTGHGTDFSYVQAYYRQRPEFPSAPPAASPAESVLLALTRFTPLLDELARAAAERPRTRFPVNWTLRPAGGIALPHYNVIQTLTSTLRLRASAELAAGQTAAARRDLALIFRLRQSMSPDPTLIAPLVDVTCIGIFMQPIWEGLAARQWSREDLDALQDSLGRINVLQEYQQAMRGERALMIARIPEDFQDGTVARQLARELPSYSGSGESPTASVLGRWLWQFLPCWPRGWYQQNTAAASRLLQTDWIDTVDPINHRVTFARNKDLPRALENTPVTPDTLLMKVYLLGLTSVANKFAQTQSVVDQAVTACALEKYFLDHQAYPAMLAELVPTYLNRAPNDVIDGAPMRYRRTADGRYQLYSIGWDGRDDGGTFVWPEDRTWRRASNPVADGKPPAFPNPDRQQGDWIWQYAPAEPPDPPVNTSRLDSLP